VSLLLRVRLVDVSINLLELRMMNGTGLEQVG